ncbi:hypothetical protein [Sphingobacterium sp.]|uniref:hypothetical protein n=1 Tax=Sphingobacterium sp. TaxID=341027 RepID=UPI002898B2B9|nr:hypothetical protein [Sphingobacterium sp.]
MENSRSLVLFLSAFGLLFCNLASAQNKPKWYVSAGAGATTVRGFNTSFADLQYSVREADASIDYQLNSKPGFLINGGVGLSGTFEQDGIIGWDVGLNVQSAGFGLTAELLDRKGELSSFYRDMLPEFGKTKNFRYWALHMPVSITYLPFEYIGFKVGADLYYQFSSNITDSEFPYGSLGRAMGLSYYTAKYQHPFQLGAHIGVFAPINEQLRIDLDAFTDITPRLNISPATSKDDFKFREMGVRLNTRYYLK